MFDTDPLDDHVELVQTVAAVGGIAAPEEWRQLHARLCRFLELSDLTPQRDELVDAIVGGADANIPLLRALALAEVANNAQTTTVVGAVRAAVLARMLQVHEAVARDVYAQVAAKFDAAAKRFVTAASTVDPEADAVRMVEADDKPRKAWRDAESFANEISRLLPAVQAAAALADIPDTDADATVLPLVADLSDCHRRKAWLAWLTTTGRCHRWAALLRCGGVIRACALDQYPGPYAEPRPLEYRRESIGNGGVRTVEVDPEDADYHPAPIDSKRGGRVVFT